MENDSTVTKVEQQTVAEESSISLSDIFFMIKRHWIFIVSAIAVCLISAFVFTQFQAPVYNASSTMLVQFQSSSSTTTITTEYQMSSNISSTYLAFMKENIVLKRAAEKTKEAGYYTDVKDNDLIPVLSSHLSVSQVGTSLYINATYSDSNPERAINIVNIVTEAVQEVADETNEDGDPKWKFLNDSIKVSSPCEVAKTQSFTTRNLLIGAAAGVVISFVYVLIRELTSFKYKTVEEVERNLGLPVLAGIPEYTLDAETTGTPTSTSEGK